MTLTEQDQQELAAWLRTDFAKRVVAAALAQQKVDVPGSRKLAPEIALDLAYAQGFAKFPETLHELSQPVKKPVAQGPRTLDYSRNPSTQ